MNNRTAALCCRWPETRRAFLRALMSGSLIWAALMLVLAGMAKAQDTGNEGLVTSHAITTFGDPPKYGPDFTHLDYVNPDAPKGGEISVSAFGTFDSFNPYSTKGISAALATIGYEEMMVSTADEVGTLYCLLCSSLEYPADKSWVIFTLRPEVTFSDGTAMSAEDVAQTYEMFKTDGLPSFAALLAHFVQGAEVLDSQRIKFTFLPDSPQRDRIQLVAGLPVMSKKWFADTGAKLNESRMEPGIGSGPYLLDSYKINARVAYKRNPDYWGKDLPINRGRNNFDRIRVEYFGDPTAAFEAFKAGAYTFRDENSSKNWATAYDFPALAKGWVKREEIANGNIATGQSFVFNLRRPQLQDIRVREAVGLMFNFEWSNATLFYGLYARITSFWENSDLKATGLPGPEELALLTPLADKLLPGVLDGEPVGVSVSGEKQLDRKNQRAASALLDEAGWDVGSDGMRRNAAGQTLVIEFLEDDDAFARIINPLVDNLRKIGVDARLTKVDTAQYQDRTRNFDFDIITSQFPTGYEPGAGLRQYFGSESVKDVFNAAGLADPAVDALITNVLNADSHASLVPAVKALDRVLRSHRFWVPQWFKDKHTVAYFDIYEHPADMPPFARGEMDFWWYNADKAAALKAAGAIN